MASNPRPADRAASAPSLFGAVMQQGFARLPPAVRALHAGGSARRWAGRADVVLGRHPLARLVARLFGFPPSGTHLLRMEIAPLAGRERWARDFGGHRFSSELSRSHGQLVERFGPFRFAFDLEAANGSLVMHLSRWSLLHLPLPMRLAPGSRAREWQQDGRFHFDVALSLPMIGDLVAYRGWLRPA